MGAQHIQVLDLERSAAGTQEVVNLAVVVEEVHFPLGDLLAREVVRFHLDGRGQLREGRTLAQRFDEGGARVGGRHGHGAGFAEDGPDALHPGGGGAGNGGRLEARGVVDVDAGVDAVGDRVVVVDDVVEIVDGKTAIGAGFACDTGAEVFAIGVWLVSTFARYQACSVQQQEEPGRTSTKEQAFCVKLENVVADLFGLIFGI